jgi:cardiolipin synthase (CMP-forming)
MAIATNGGEPRTAARTSSDAAILLGGTLFSLPNLITGARLVATLPIVWLIVVGAYQPAFWLFVVAASSDAVDGFVAKRFGSRTTLGTWFDPAADKVLLVSVYLALAHVGLLPAWLVLLIVLRDLVVALGALVLQRRGLLFQIQPLAIGKLNTLAQLLLAGLVQGVAAGIAPLGWAIDGSIYTVALLTLVSGAAYVAQGTRMALAPGKPS